MLVMAAAVSLHDAPAAPARPRPSPAPASGLTDRERRIVLALAVAVIPPGSAFEPGGESTVRRFESWLHGANAFQLRVIKSILWAAELAALPSTGRMLSALPPERATRLLEGWAHSKVHARR